MKSKVKNKIMKKRKKIDEKKIKWATSTDEQNCSVEEQNIIAAE
jgi:hypothetical protein